MFKIRSSTRGRFISKLEGHSISLQIVMIVTQSLGIDKRKHIINTVQTSDISFAQPLIDTLPYYLNCKRPHSTTITKTEFIEALRITTASIIARSIVWVLAKSCPEPIDDDQSLQVRQDGFNKELSATQEVFRTGQIFNYEKPRRGDTRHHVPTREMADRLINKLSSRQSVIFPCVNRTKNVSRQTAIEYRQYDPSKEIPEVRSVDLEILWRNQGVQIGGNSELREVWRLNELKPRFYFCQGGDSYWAARFIKPVTVAVLEAIASTQKKIRLFLPSSLNFNVNTDTVLVWDFISFTSKLSELKFFLNRLIDLIPKDLDVLAFDYRYGRFHINVCELLSNYNRMINVSSTFSVERIAPELRGDIPILAEFLSMNSGLLGTNGNIGLSMALHGQVIDSIDSSARSGCSIGDDAIKITQDPERVISVMVQLGDIHPDKFGKLFDEGTLKFMKRRLWIDDMGQLRIDTLVAFPAFSVVDDEEIGTRTTGAQSEFDRISKIVGQVSNALWALPPINHLLDEDDRNLTESYFMSVYRTLRFPQRGAHRGAHLEILKGRSPWAIPPIQAECFTTLWHEVLVDQDPTLSAEIFLSYHVEAKRIPNKGETIVWNESPFLSALEDLEIAESTPLTEVVYCNTLSNRVRIKQAYDKFRRHEPKVVQVTFLKDIPDEFRSMFAIRSGYVEAGCFHML